MTLLAYKRDVIAGFLVSGMVFVSVPFISLGSDRDVLYVDSSSNGTQDGSKKHPFRTIDQAMNVAENGTDIHVAKGTYKENVKIEKDVRLYGAGSDKTTIKADDDDTTVVTMKHKTRIEDVTIKDGSMGILVRQDSRAEIYNVVIEDNDDEGIFLEKAKTRNDYKISIADSVIKENGDAGIYSNERKLTIKDCEIRDNGSDGIIMEDEVEAWLEDNRIKDNKKSGIRIELDRSDIDIRNNSIKNNGREGIEINAYGDYGRVDINKSTFYDNERYAIARVVRGSATTSLFDNVIVRGETKYEGNVFGTLSNVIRVR